MVLIADWMKRVAEICVSAKSEEGLASFEAALSDIREEVRELALKFPLPTEG